MNIKTFLEKTTQESYITFIDRVVNYMVNEYRCNTMTAKETIIRAIAERWHICQCPTGSIGIQFNDNGICCSFSSSEISATYTLCKKDC